MSAQPLESRLSDLEGTYRQVDKRLDTLHADLRELRNDFNQRFNWLVGISVTSALATVGVVVGFFESITSHLVLR